MTALDANPAPMVRLSIDCPNAVFTAFGGELFAVAVLSARVLVLSVSLFQSLVERNQLALRLPHRRGQGMTWAFAVLV